MDTAAEILKAWRLMRFLMTIDFGADHRMSRVLTEVAKGDVP